MDLKDVPYHCCQQCQGLFPGSQALLDHKRHCTGDKVAADATMFAVDRETFLRLAAQAKASQSQPSPSNVTDKSSIVQSFIQSPTSTAGPGSQYTVRIIKKLKDLNKSNLIDVNNMVKEVVVANDAAEGNSGAKKTVRLIGIRHKQQEETKQEADDVKPKMVHNKIVRKNVRGEVLSQKRVVRVADDGDNYDDDDDGPSADSGSSQSQIDAMVAASMSVDSIVNPQTATTAQSQSLISRSQSEQVSLSSSQSKQVLLSSSQPQVVEDSQSKQPSVDDETKSNIQPIFRIITMNENPEFFHEEVKSGSPPSQEATWITSEMGQTQQKAEADGLVQTENFSVCTKPSASEDQQTSLPTPMSITKLVWKTSSIMETSSEQDTNQSTTQLYGLEKLSDIASRVDREADSDPPEEVMQTIDTIMKYEDDKNPESDSEAAELQKIRRNPAGLYTCDICPYRTRFLGMYRRHLDQAHNSGKKFKCDVCGAEFLYRRLFKVHMNTHMGFKCPQCDKMFSRCNDRDRHIKQIHAAEKIAYKCDHCHYISSYKHMMREHLRKHTGVTLTCPVEGCSFRTIYQRALHHHRNTVHNPVKRFRCECKYATNDRGLFHRHMMLHTSSVPEKCTHCNYSSKVPRNMRQHQRLHSHRPQSQPNYCCNRCDYSTANKATFRTHVLWHQGIWPWNCSECNHGAICKEKVQQHVVKTHGGKGQARSSTPKNLDIEAYRRPNVEQIIIRDDPIIDADIMKEEVVGGEASEPMIVEEEIKEAEDVVVEEVDMIIAPDQEPVEPLYQCAFCEFSSLDLDEVQVHLANDHPEDPPDPSLEQVITNTVEYIQGSPDDLIAAQASPADGDFAEASYTEVSLQVLDVPGGAEAEAAETILHLQDAPLDVTNTCKQEIP